MNRVLGIDIGGANLKLADSEGWAVSEPFALWREPDRLAAVLATLLRRAPRNLPLVVTMTGELADCFADKAVGVRHILASLQSAVGDRTIRVYRLDGQLVPLNSARNEPYRVAAANWHALATFVSRYLTRGTGLLLDVGSTTTDIIPILCGRPESLGMSDTQRLRYGNLLYTGVDRSPVCGVVQSVPYRDTICPVAQELFATMRDVYIVLGDLAESAKDCNTADGCPATREHSVRRLARCLCADATEFGDDDAYQLARAATSSQSESIQDAIQRVLAACNSGGRPRAAGLEIVVSGQGAFLARRAARSLWPEVRVIDLANVLTRTQAIAAPAFALATLAAERGEL